MVSSEHIVIRAVIPHPDDPATHLRAPSGEFPAHLHEIGEGTHEEGLRRLGRELIGCINLSVDRRVESSVGEIVYQTKPLDLVPDQDDLFQWR